MRAPMATAAVWAGAPPVEVALEAAEARLLVTPATLDDTLDSSAWALDLGAPVAVAMKLLREEALAPASLVTLATSLEMPAARVEACDLRPSILVDALETTPPTAVESSLSTSGWGLAWTAEARARRRALENFMAVLNVVMNAVMNVVMATKVLWGRWKHKSTSKDGQTGTERERKKKQRCTNKEEKRLQVYLLYILWPRTASPLALAFVFVKPRPRTRCLVPKRVKNRGTKARNPSPSPSFPLLDSQQ